MKILLVGEFSGVHNNLKVGLLELGHEVCLAADGDGYRKFDSDISLAPYSSRILGKIFNVLHVLMNLPKFIGYDIVQYLSPNHLPYYLHYLGITRLLFLLNKKSIYYVCGTDPAFLAAQGKFKYSPFDLITLEKPIYGNLYGRYYKWFTFAVDVLIPSMYTYWVGYSDNPKLSSPIPLPALPLEDYTIRDLNGPISITHGITRKHFKGSEYIINAIEKIKLNYGKRVNIQVVEKLAFKDYVPLLGGSDIVVDQCKSYDYGMNSIFALQHGCIVLSGAEECAIEYLGIVNSPVINILPSEQDVYLKLESLILLDRSEIKELQAKSVAYVKEYHDIKKVSIKFESLYAKILNK
jgi:hypothetical protein